MVVGAWVAEWVSDWAVVAAFILTVLSSSPNDVGENVRDVVVGPRRTKQRDGEAPFLRGLSLPRRPALIAVQVRQSEALGGVYVGLVKQRNRVVACLLDGPPEAVALDLPRLVIHLIRRRDPGVVDVLRPLARGTLRRYFGRGGAAGQRSQLVVPLVWWWW